jgi:alkane 1-monooxygenase
MHPIVFLAPLLLLVAGWIGVLAGGWFVWFVPAFSFGLLPILDQLDRGDTANPTAVEETGRLASWFFDAVLFAIVPGQLGLVVAMMAQIHAGAYSVGELIGVVATVGISCGAFGINVAHELGHRRERAHQWGAWLLLLSTHYMHFLVEHNRGHHRRVATPDDPASARRGETLYTFLPRSIVGSWRSAWSLEAERLAALDRSPWAWDNLVLRFAVVQLAAAAAALAAFGPLALGAWLVASLGGIVLLETVNYVEHYGLSRSRAEHGGWERVRPVHSWNSNRPMGRIFLFELTRHADHHANATRPYPVLRHHDEAPELPMGYPAMVLLALVPPLFMAVMDGRLDQAPETVGY